MVDEHTLSKAAACLREAGVALPTLSQLADPSTLPQRALAALAQAGPDAPDPANLWRVHWFNDERARVASTCPAISCCRKR